MPEPPTGVDSGCADAPQGHGHGQAFGMKCILRARMHFCIDIYSSCAILGASGGAMAGETTTISTRRDEAVQQLREAIVSGALAAGTVIKDAELAARLGVSITPVREALAQLAVEGLIEMPPNRAKRVAPFGKRNAVELCVVMRVLSVTAYELGLPRLLFADLENMRAAHRATVAALARSDGSAA